MKNSIHKPRIRTQFKRPDSDHILSILKNLLIKSAIVITIILIALIISSINTPSALSLTEKLNNTLSYEFKPIEDSKRIYSWGRDKVSETISVIPAMKTRPNPTYIAPIQGAIYRSYDQDIQINGNIEKNGGLDIIVEGDENPISIINGLVKKVEEKDNKGYYVTIANEDMIVVYGYLKTAYVKEGESINQGAEIGSIGTNKDGSKYLRFEIFIDNKAVDPAEYIDI